MEDLKRVAATGTLHGTYGVQDTNAVREGLMHMNLTGKRILVIGSENPWLEACALEAGATEVHTLEYGRIHSTHPRIKTFTPDEFRELYLNRSMALYDAVATFSSVEHSGLGRYGDAINPWGDKQTLARAWCVTKPEGLLLLGVQECGGADRVRGRGITLIHGLIGINCNT